MSKLTPPERGTLAGAALVFLAAFATGLGVAMADSSISAAEAALTAFCEALVAALAAGGVGWAVTHPKPATSKTERP